MGDAWTPQGAAWKKQQFRGNAQPNCGNRKQNGVTHGRHRGQHAKTTSVQAIPGEAAETTTKRGDAWTPYWGA